METHCGVAPIVVNLTKKIKSGEGGRRTEQGGSSLTHLRFPPTPLQKIRTQQVVLFKSGTLIKKDSHKAVTSYSIFLCACYVAGGEKTLRMRDLK